MTEKSKFSYQIWSGLLKYINKQDRLPTLKSIINTFKVSNRVAYAYLFALRNRMELYSDVDAVNKLASCRDKSRRIVKDNSNLLTKNKKLEEQIDFFMALEYLKKVNFNDFKISQADMSKDENTAIACLSDSHVEELIEKEVINNYNEYNIKIADKRMKLFFTRLLFLIDGLRKGGWKINNLVLAVLGDMITGYIHEEYMESNELSPTEACLLVEDWLIRGIEFLLNFGNFKNLTLIMMRGNHGRTSRRKKYATGYKNSFEFMIYSHVKKYFDKKTYDNINIIMPLGEFATLDIYDKTIVTGHGDHFNYQGGVGGVEIPFKRWMYKMGNILPADKYMIGHWHQYINMPQGLINGSVIGYNAFAMGKAFKPEPPQQQLQLLDSKRGFTVNIPIILEDW